MGYLVQKAGILVHKTERILLGDLNMDPFFYIKNNVVTDEANLRMTGASAFGLFRAIGLVGIVVTLMVVGIQFMHAKQGQKLDLIKTRLEIEFVIGVLIFSFLFWMEQIFSIVNTFAG